jgi:hypothetical protein
MTLTLSTSKLHQPTVSRQPDALLPQGTLLRLYSCSEDLTVGLPFPPELWVAVSRVSGTRLTLNRGRIAVTNGQWAYTHTSKVVSGVREACNDINVVLSKGLARPSHESYHRYSTDRSLDEETAF